MRPFLSTLAILTFVVAAAGTAEAGCVGGAVAGGIAGHMAGHGKLGAAAGCAVGHHEAKKKQNQGDQSGK